MDDDLDGAERLVNPFPFADKEPLSCSASAQHLDVSVQEGGIRDVGMVQLSVRFIPHTLWSKVLIASKLSLVYTEYVC